MRKSGGLKTEAFECNCSFGEIIVSTNQQASPTEIEYLNLSNQEVKYLNHKTSMVEDEDVQNHRNSQIRSLSSFKFFDHHQGRTESFREDLENTEFKKESKKMTEKELAKLSIT